MSFWSRVSVVMIVLDAEDVLPDALKSIPDDAEIIVADGGSSDRSASIARQHNARIMTQDQAAIDRAQGNFDVARNQAAQQAARDWVFFLDADERITDALAHEIAALDDDPACNAYDMPRINRFWGKPVRLLGEDRQIRLVRQGKGRYKGTALHRKIAVDGPVGHLDTSLLHLNIRRWSDVRLRFHRYLPSEARQHDPETTRLRSVLLGCHMFRYYYFNNTAWRDGWRGLLVSLIYAVYHAAAAWNARRYIDS